MGVYYSFDSLNPAQIPTTPPIVLNKIDDMENELSPQRLGSSSPTVEPTNIPIQMRDFVFIRTI